MADDEGQRVGGNRSRPTAPPPSPRARGKPARADDAFRSLPGRERLRVTWAIMLGRPLPPPLARVAEDHVRHLEWFGWYRYVALIFAVLFLFMAAVQQTVHKTAGWTHAFWWVIGVGWLGLAALCFAMVAHAQRAGRDGCWPQS